MAQGALPFQYEAETAASGVTALGGLPVYLDLIKASGLDVAIRKHVRVAGEQGWLDLQMIVALIVLNLAGGDGLEDLERLERDAGFVQVMREVERRLLPRADRRALRTRWRKPRRRAVPSPSAMWLARFHDAAAGQPRPPARLDAAGKRLMLRRRHQTVLQNPQGAGDLASAPPPKPGPPRAGPVNQAPATAAGAC